MSEDLRGQEPRWDVRRCPLELSVHGAGTTTSIEIAGAILGIGRTKAYELARTGDFPVALIRAGRRYLVPVPALLALLGAPADAHRDSQSTRQDGAGRGPLLTAAPPPSLSSRP